MCLSKAYIDRNGEKEWSYWFDFSRDDKAYDIIPTDDGGYILAGAMNTDSATLGSDAVIIKLRNEDE